MTSVLTWYDVLGVLPDATPEEIREAGQARKATLQQGTKAGAAPEVLSAAERALQAVEEAGRVLADPVARESYDQEIGIFRSGEGLTPPSRGPSGPDVSLGEGWSQANEEALEPYSDPRARVAVPDVRGLFFQACMHVTGRIGLHVATAMSIALLGERGAHPAIRKLTGTGHRQAVAETVLELLGPDGAAESEASGEFLLTRCLSIAGGTTQILLNQVGERVLGLPR